MQLVFFVFFPKQLTINWSEILPQAWEEISNVPSTLFKCRHETLEAFEETLTATSVQPPRVSQR